MKAAHMTEREIDAYYRRRQEENRKRIHALRAKRHIREERGRLFQRSLAAAVSLIVCTIFLKLNFQVQQQTGRVLALQNEVDELRLKNSDAEKRIADAGNLPAIQRKAVSYGMGYPKEGNVIYYTLEEQDYMFQTGDIPGS